MKSQLEEAFSKEMSHEEFTAHQKQSPPWLLVTLYRKAATLLSKPTVLVNLLPDEQSQDGAGGPKPLQDQPETSLHGTF